MNNDLILEWTGLTIRLKVGPDFCTGGDEWLVSLYNLDEETHRRTVRTPSRDYSEWYHLRVWSYSPMFVHGPGVAHGRFCRVLDSDTGLPRPFRLTSHLFLITDTRSLKRERVELETR